MSSYADEIVTLLSADVTLMGYLTGGVINFPAGGRKGLNRIMVPGAFDENLGLLKPTCVILETDESADGQAVDGQGIFMSTVTPEYLWIYDHGDNGYSTIEAAHDRIYKLLHAKQITGAFQVLWQKSIRFKREPLLKDAGYFRAQYNVYGFRTNQ